jgi:hypothetical protein
VAGACAADGLVEAAEEASDGMGTSLLAASARWVGAHLG